MVLWWSTTSDIFTLIVDTILNDEMKMKFLNAAVCCLVCMSLPHIWLCLPWHFPCVFLRPVGRSPQRPATALSQARLQRFSQNSHNTKCCTGMLLFFPTLTFSWFVFLDFTLSLSLTGNATTWSTWEYPRRQSKPHSSLLLPWLHNKTN